MKKIIDEYIIKAETLLLIRPNNILIESYILNLKSFKNASNVRLIGLYEVIPLVYEVLESEEDIARTWEVFNTFSVMVKNAKKPSTADRLI